MPRALPLFLAILVVSIAAACGGAQTPELEHGAGPVAREIVPLRRKACEGDSERMTDADGDGRANIRHAFNGQTPACSEVDVNMDGRVDITRLFDDSGKLALEQHDFDFDGRADQQAFFENGKLVRKELDTDFDRMVDTWVWCEGPYMTRLERDRHHTGRVDTWEEYERGLLQRAMYDDNNDAQVERWETYRLGRLTEVTLDVDRDGKPDQREEISPLMSSSAPEPVSCDGTPIPHAPAPPQAPAAPQAPAPAATDGEGATEGGASSEQEAAEQTEEEGAEP